MRETSTIHYTFEDVSGSAETFNKGDFEKIVEKEEKIGTVLVELVGENESIEVPLLKGYRKPYDSDITDEIGTEHYIFYEELKNYEKVEKRLDETLVPTVDRDSYKMGTGYDVKKIKKICNEENVNYEDFCKYMQEK